MTLKRLNIVAFDIPYPADYGGVIDIYFKIKALHKQGVAITLHCFQYNKLPQAQLEKYCTKVIYYKRKKGLSYLFSNKPYIVVTRNSKQLLSNLLLNDYPILFEGLHTCYFLNAPQLRQRKKIVRTHNIEQDYYHGLQQASKNLLKTIYYFLEKKKLKKYETNLKNADRLATISEKDEQYFHKNYKNTCYIPAFTPFEKVESACGFGGYFLFHGQLSVEENSKAVQFLMDEVFKTLEYKLIIAGKNPSEELKKQIALSKNVELIANPGKNEMHNLIRNAHASVLPTFQSTGIKLKLLFSLFSGRHVIANNLMLGNKKLKSLCIVANTTNEFISAVKRVKHIEFTEQEVQKRTKVLNNFSNSENTNKLLKIFESNA